MVSIAAASGLLIVTAAAIAFGLLRHRELFVIAVTAPLPGLLLAAGLCAWLAPDALVLLPLAWLFGLVLALVPLDDLAVRLLDGTPPQSAYRAAVSAHRGGLLLLTLAASLALVPLGGVPGDGGLAAAIVLMLVGAGVPALWALYPAADADFGEDFAVRANRTRERAQQWLDGVLPLAGPRWGLTTAGIALVFAMLGAFGAGDVVLTPRLAMAHPALSLAGGLAVAGVGCVTIVDWRWIAASLASLALAGLAGLWCLSLSGATLDATSAAAFVLVLAVGAVPIFSFGAAAGRLAQEGDPAPVVVARLLSRRAPGLFFIGVAAPAALGASALFGGGPALVLAGMAAAAAAGPFVFQPALAAAIERVFPRPGAIEAGYRLP